MTEAEMELLDELKATLDRLNELNERARRMEEQVAEMQRLVYGHPHLELVRGSLDR